MKKISAALFLALAVSMTSCSTEKKEAAQTETKDAATQTAATSAELASTTINIPTAKCSSCANTISTALKGVDGVQDVKVDAEGKKAEVKYIAAKANLASLENAIAKAGYDANSTKRDQAAYDKLESCCKDGGH